MAGAGRQLPRRGTVPSRDRPHLQAHPAAVGTVVRAPGEELLQGHRGRGCPGSHHARCQGRGSRDAQRVPPSRRAHLRGRTRSVACTRVPLPRVVLHDGRQAQRSLWRAVLRRLRQVRAQSHRAALCRDRGRHLRVPDSRFGDRHRLVVGRLPPRARGTQARRVLPVLLAHDARTQLEGGDRGLPRGLPLRLTSQELRLQDQPVEHGDLRRLRSARARGVRVARY